jgi:hypothetical protein
MALPGKQAQQSPVPWSGLVLVFSMSQQTRRTQVDIQDLLPLWFCKVESGAFENPG